MPDPASQRLRRAQHPRHRRQAHPLHPQRDVDRHRHGGLRSLDRRARCAVQHRRRPARARAPRRRRRRRRLASAPRPVVDLQPRGVRSRSRSGWAWARAIWCSPSRPTARPSTAPSERRRRLGCGPTASTRAPPPRSSPSTSAGITDDHLLECATEDRNRIFNLGYFTWVEQQGVAARRLRGAAVAGVLDRPARPRAEVGRRDRRVQRPDGRAPFGERRGDLVRRLRLARIPSLGHAVSLPPLRPPR